jgi:outer membrane protein OmpA-like peptidoglycan-associated protein
MKKHCFLFLFWLPISTISAQNFIDKSVWQFTILFDVNQSTIQPQFQTKLDSLAIGMEKDTAYQIKINAHTDNTGSNDLNEKLSKSRAESIKSYLKGRGIDEKRLVLSWKGALEPISDNNTEGGKTLNRRVSIDVLRRIYLSKITSTVKNDLGDVVPNALVTMRSKYLSDSTVTDSLGVFSLNVPYKQNAIIEVTAKDHFYDKQIINIGALNIRIKDFLIAKAEIGKKIRIKDLNFVGGYADLLKESLPNLKVILLFLRLNPTYKIELAGHVNGTNRTISSMSSLDYTLSVERAKTVYDLLIQNGIDEKRLVYKGYANWEMLFPNATSEESMTANRRVEIRVLEK